MAVFMRGIQRYPPHKCSSLGYNFASAKCKYSNQKNCSNSSRLVAKCSLVTLWEWNKTQWMQNIFCKRRNCSYLHVKEMSELKYKNKSRIYFNSNARARQMFSPLWCSYLISQRNDWVIKLAHWCLWETFIFLQSWTSASMILAPNTKWIILWTFYFLTNFTRKRLSVKETTSIYYRKKLEQGYMPLLCLH